VTVTNVGGRSATRNVTFRLDVDGDGTLEPTDLERQDRANVTLGSGERRTVDLAAYTAGLDPGTYRYGVFTANDSATGVVNVTRPPRAAATVQFDDSTVVNGTRTIRVDRANYTGGRYYVVVHAEASPGDGTVDLGTPLGNSTELASGAHTDVSVDLDPVVAGGDSVDALTRDRSLVAVIHRTDPGGDSFAGVVRADDRPVADAAAVEVRDVSQVTVGPPDSDATFDSIAHALDSVREGGTVVLRPGTYATQVRLDRNVTLSAPDGATISGRGVQETITTGVIVADGAAPTVEGLTIRDFDWGVSAQGTAGDWTLRNLSIRNVDIGIQAADATGSWAVHGSTVVDADTEAVQARRTTGDWTLSDSRVRDGSDAGIDATRATGDWTLDSTTVRGVDGAAVEATRTEGDWRVRGVTVRNATEGVDATRAAGDWRVRGTDVEDSVLGAVVAVDTTGDWTVTNATLRGNYRGVNATRAAGAWSVTGSRLAANGLGLDARGAAAGSATRNWWGAADGPNGVFDGGGDAVRGNALARPFYTDADLTALSAPVRASVTFDGATVPPGTTTVRVDRANYTGGPYVVVLARERSSGDGEPNRSAPVGVSAPLSTGAHTDVPVDVGATLSDDDGLDSLDANTTLVARLYRAGPPNATHGEATNATAEAAVTVEPPTTTVAAGTATAAANGTATAAANGTATVPIRARNVTDAVYFAATVSYDPAVANVTDIVVPGLDYDPTVSIDNESGTARFQAQYTGRDAPVANLTLDVTAATDASTPIRVTAATVYRGDAADPTVETANGRLTVVDPRATVTDTTLDVTTVRPNGTVTVNATLSNPTTVAGPVTVPLRVDGVTTTTLTRSLPADGNVTARFTYTPESTGTRTLAVGDGANRSLVVAAVDIEETNTTTRVGGRTAPGTPLSVPFNGTNGTTDAGVSLDRLNVSTTRETDVSLSVNVSADPGGAPALGDAAAYINVSESAPEDAFDRVVFEFTVETERLSDPATAELYRYHDGSWSALETTYLGVEDGRHQFRTLSPGLSVFAVRDAPSPAEDADDVSDETYDGQDTPTDSTDDSSTPEPAPESGDDTTPDGSTATATAPDDEEGTAAPPATPEPDAGDGSTATAAPAPDRETTPSPEPAGFDPRGIGALALFLVAVVLGALWYRRR
jgi:PGF-pre-PGF domain-containing protein